MRSAKYPAKSVPVSGASLPCSRIWRNIYAYVHDHIAARGEDEEPQRDHKGGRDQEEAAGGVTGRSAGGGELD